jgi:hypothetical protein
VYTNVMIRLLLPLLLLLLLLQMLSLAQAAEWLSGEANIPPSPALDAWAPNNSSSNNRRSPSPCNSSSFLGVDPTAHTSHGVVHSSGSAGGTSAADMAKSWRGQQQLQQQRPWTLQWQLQQQGVMCPANAVNVVTSNGSSVSFGYFAGSYIPSSLAAVQSAAAGDTGSSAFAPHAVLPSSTAAFPGLPLNALHVLPQQQHPLGAEPAAVAAGDEAESSILQQQLDAGELVLFRDLAQGCEGLQLLLQCSLAGQAQQQQVCRLLVAQGTPAEQVVEGEGATFIQKIPLDNLCVLPVLAEIPVACHAQIHKR